jgi:hypothetical protein
MRQEVGEREKRSRPKSNKIRQSRVTATILYGAYGCVDQRNFMCDLHDAFCDGGYQIRTDDIRAFTGMDPVGPEGWTAKALLAWEVRRFELLTRPIIASGLSMEGLVVPHNPSMGLVTSCEDFKRATRRDRMRAMLRRIKEELRRRTHEPIPEQGAWLKQVVSVRCTSAIGGKAEVIRTSPN